MTVRLGLAHYWRDVAVLFRQNGTQPIERLIAFPEEAKVHDLVEIAPGKFLLLCDSYFAGRWFVTLQQWNCATWTYQEMRLPDRMRWGEIILSPDGLSFAVHASIGWGTQYILRGRWGANAHFVKFRLEYGVEFSIADIDDAGNVILSVSGGHHGLRLYKLLANFQVAQHFGTVTAADFPTLKTWPFAMPDTVARGHVARANLLPQVELPESAAAAQMSNSVGPECLSPRLTATLVDGRLADPI